MYGNIIIVSLLLLGTQKVFNTYLINHLVTRGTTYQYTARSFNHKYFDDSGLLFPVTGNVIKELLITDLVEGL